MIITQAHIDKFGVLADQTIEGLSPGFNVFLGRNEAGKSTTMQFFKAMFFGYKRGNRSLDPISTKKGVQAGGTLLLTSNAGEGITLTRRPGEKLGGLSLFSSQGVALPDIVLQQLLGNVSTDVFDNVFAFNIKSLMDVSTLSGQDIRLALHGAAFGLGARSPLSVMKELDKRMAVLLKQDKAGVNARINALVTELNDIDSRLQERGPDIEKYGILEQQLEELDAQMAQLQGRRTTQQRTVRMWEQRLALWQHWQELTHVQGQLAVLGEPSGTALAAAMNSSEDQSIFMSDSLHRLKALQDKEYDASVRAATANDLLQRTQEEITTLGAGQEIIGQRATIAALREQKEARSVDVAAVSGLAFKIQHLTAAQTDCFTRLGQGWTIEKAQQADTSLHIIDAIAQHETALLKAAQQVQQEQQILQRLEQDCYAAQDAMHMLQQQIVDEGIEMPPAVEVDALAGLYSQARVQITELATARIRVQQTSQAVYAALGNIDVSWVPERLETIEDFPAVRQQAQQCSVQLLAAQQDCAAATSLVQRLDAQLHQHTVQYKQLQHELAQHQAEPTEAALKQYRGTLQQLERNATLRVMATQQVMQVTSVIDQSRSAAKQLPIDSEWLSLASVVLLAAGAGTVTYGIMQDHIISLIVGGVLCVLWAIGAGLVWGKKTLFAGDSMGVAHALQAQQLAKAQGDLARIEAQMTEQMQQLAGWCSVFPADFTHVDVAVQYAQDHLGLAWQQQGIAAAKQQNLAAVQGALHQLQEQAKAAAGQLEQATKRHSELLATWQQLTEKLLLPAAFGPETLALFFNAVDMARNAHQENTVAVAQVAALQANIVRCVHTAAGLPLFGMYFSQEQRLLITTWAQEGNCAATNDAGEAPAQDALLRELLDCVSNGFTRLRQVQSQEQEAQTQRRVVAERKEQVQRLVARIEQVKASLAEANAQHIAAQEKWQQWLIAYGFAATLTPETAKEAIQLLQNIQEQNNSIGILQQEVAACKTRLGAYLSQLYAVVTQCNVSTGTQLAELLPQGLDEAALAAYCGNHASELFATAETVLESIVQLLEQASVQQTRQQALGDRVKEYEQTIQEAVIAQNFAAQGLAQMYASADVADAEAFSAAFTQWERKQALYKRRSELLGAFHAISKEEATSVEELLAVFASANEEQLQEAYAEARLAYETLQTEAEQKAEIRGTLRQEQKGLVSGEENAHLWRQHSIVKDTLQQTVRQWRLLALSRHLMSAAKTRFEQEGQQGVIGIASKIFAHITHGEYTGITATAEEGAFHAVHRSGTLKDPEKELSQGTKEQLYLALRLGYIQNHASNAEPVPVFMDDILVNFDKKRAWHAAETLLQFAQGNQVLFFTCHPSTAEMFAQVASGIAPLVPTNYYDIIGGNISKQLAIDS